MTFKRWLVLAGLLACASCSYAGFYGGKTTPHGHTSAAGDGGALVNPAITGTISPQTVAVSSLNVNGVYNITHSTTVGQDFSAACPGELVRTLNITTTGGPVMVLTTLVQTYRTTSGGVASGSMYVCRDGFGIDGGNTEFLLNNGGNQQDHNINMQIMTVDYDAAPGVHTYTLNKLVSSSAFGSSSNLASSLILIELAKP